MGAEQGKPQSQGEIPADRKMGMAIRDLKAHVEWKMGLLPDLAQNFHLNDDAIASLRGYLQEELDYLSNLPEEATLRQVMENHFKRGAVVRERVTGKR